MKELSVVLIFSFFIIPYINAACTNGWVNYKDNKCYFFSKTKEKWYDASVLCQSFGSKLAEPKTQEEVTFLGRQTHQIGNGGNYFIGIHDIFLEGQWVYAGSREPVTITMPWARGAPDNFHEEDCVEMGSAPEWHELWGDVPCSSTLYYICEYEQNYEYQQGQVIG